MDRNTTFVAAALAFAASALVSQLDLRGASSTPPAPASARAAAGPSYAALLADLDRRIESLQQRANSRTDDWLTRAHLGAALLERAGLTQKLDDFARVEAVLAEAFSIAPTGSGPLLLAARFNVAVHRLGAAERYLDLIDRRAVPRRDEELLARVLRAEIALQRGQYDLARDGLTAVAAVAPAAATVELALYHARTGNPDEAAALLEQALGATPTTDPRRRAWLRLQLGIVAMERGEFRDALRHFHAADAELPGWWLVREHIAEIHHRRDQHREAIALFEDLVRTADLPQHLDALAALYRHTGQPERAEPRIAEAAARWQQQLDRFPESAMGHALQHYLQFGPPERALELALANHALRPGGSAQVALAQAYLAVGRPADALAVLEAALRTPYRSARLHDVAARAYAALGHTAAAEEQQARCFAVNPRYTRDDHAH
ncbi:MAG TPA: tetratricopeptide repeat protein [Nannocystis sp.]